MIDIERFVFGTMVIYVFIMSFKFASFKFNAERRIENLEAQVRRMYDKIKTLETLNSRR